VGATFTKACSADHDVWSCDLALADGKQGRIVWNAARSFDASFTSKYKVGAEFNQVRDLSGHEAAVTDGVMAIGTKPVLVEGARGK